MIECGVVIAKTGLPLYWHVPPGRTAGSIPDTRSLWDVFWENRGNILGFAHSHPGSGIPGPSQTDLGTFIAIEAALGERFNWWITSSDRLLVCNWTPDGLPPWGKHSYSTSKGKQHHYLGVVLYDEPPWVNELREASATA